VAVACNPGLTIALDRLPDGSDDSAKPPHGPFGHTLVSTPDGKPAEIDSFFTNATCAVCHQRQFNELKGSMHSAAHEEPLYRRFAELARKEAGAKVYTYCSGCHSAAGVVSGLIPSKHDSELPATAKAGVTCDICHQISRLTGHEGGWGEQGNASFALRNGNHSSDSPRRVGLAWQARIGAARLAVSPRGCRMVSGVRDFRRVLSGVKPPAPPVAMKPGFLIL
jgi:hypothetical protein